MKSLLLFLFSVVVVRAELPRGQVVLSELKGEVTVKPGKGEARKLLSGEALSEDDELTTARGSSVELAFSNGLRVQVAPGSVLKLSVFRQAKKTTLGRPPEELADDGSVVDLSLRVGRMAIVCPPLQARSLVSVRTLQGRSDLVKEGVYELGVERVNTGELVTKSVVLSGVLKFTPEGKGEVRVLSVESGNRLLATSVGGVSAPVSLEKTKLDSAEVEALAKALNIESTRVPVIPQPAPKGPAPISTPPMAGGAGTQEAVKVITQSIVDRLVEANPSPTGG